MDYPDTEELVKRFYSSSYAIVSFLFENNGFLTFSAIDKVTYEKIFITVSEYKEDSKKQLKIFAHLHKFEHPNILIPSKKEDLLDDRISLEFPWLAPSFKTFLISKPTKLVILKVLFQVGNALLYLKKKKKCHYNISSDNIMMREQTPYLTNFYDMEVISKSTRKNTKKSIPEYLKSPEFLLLQDPNYPHDAWSFGVLRFSLEGLRPDLFLKLTEKDYTRNLRSKTFCHTFDSSTDENAFFKRIFSLDPKLRMPIEEIVVHPLFDSVREDFNTVKRQKTKL